MEFFEKLFKLKENKTNTKTEFYAGLTTFMTMAYILIVNPNILSATGMDKGALFTSTALGAALATMIMALAANYPFALAPGMGLNAFFAFSVVLTMGYTWEQAMTAVLIEGTIFLLLSLVNAREAIFNAIPKSLKQAAGVGIGMFITFLGFQNSGIIVHNDATLVGIGNVHSIVVIMTFIGIIVTIFFVIKNVTGALLWGILFTYLIGIIAQLTGLYKVDPDQGMFSLIPSGIASLPPSIAPVFMKFDFSKALNFDFIVVMFSFLFINLFDTVATLVGVSEKAGFLDKDGKLPRLKNALLADGIGAAAGAILGTSTVTTYVESASGVANGGRTGMTSFVTACLFLVALIFSPLITSIPAFATSPALIVVGLFMMESVVKIDFSDYTDGFPAFITIIMMPLTYSISQGLVFGVLTYVILKFITGRKSELNYVILIIAALFLIKLIVGKA